MQHGHITATYLPEPPIEPIEPRPGPHTFFILQPFNPLPPTALQLQHTPSRARIHAALQCQCACRATVAAVAKHLVVSLRSVRRRHAAPDLIDMPRKVPSAGNAVA